MEKSVYTNFGVLKEVESKVTLWRPKSYTHKEWYKEFFSGCLTYLENGGVVKYSYKPTSPKFTYIPLPKDLIEAILVYRPTGVKKYYFIACLVDTMLERDRK